MLVNGVVTGSRPVTAPVGGISAPPDRSEFSHVLLPTVTEVKADGTTITIYRVGFTVTWRVDPRPAVVGAKNRILGKVTSVVYLTDPISYGTAPDTGPPTAVRDALRLVSSESHLIVAPIVRGATAKVVTAALRLAPIALSGVRGAAIVTGMVWAAVRHRSFFTSPSVYGSVFFYLGKGGHGEVGRTVGDAVVIWNDVGLVRSPGPVFGFGPSKSFECFDTVTLNNMPVKIPVPPALTTAKVTVTEPVFPLPSTKDTFGAKIEGIDVVTTMTILLEGVRGTTMAEVGPGGA